MIGPVNTGGGNSGSSEIANALGLYIDSEGYLCQRTEEDNNNG